MKHLIMFLFVTALSNGFFQYNFINNSINESTKPIFIGAENTCPANTQNPNNISRKIIETLLNSPTRKDDRIESGIDGLDIVDLKVLKTSTDEFACTKLNEFIEQWKLGGEIDWKYTYYKIEQFYFLVLWYDGSSMGFNPIYVFDSKFNPVGIWAI